MKILTILVTVCLLACGCMSKYDKLSEKHAYDNTHGLFLDLNNGKSQGEIDTIIAEAFQVSQTGDFVAFKEKVNELLLSETSVDIAVARAEAWLRYEQSKREPKDGDVPRLLSED